MTLQRTRIAPSLRLCSTHESWLPWPGRGRYRGVCCAPDAEGELTGRAVPFGPWGSARCHLVRKQDLSRAGGSARRRASADGLWVTATGGLASGGQEFAGVGVDGLDGDLVAQAFQALDVVAGLAAGVHALFVVVRAEVLVAGFGDG